MPKDYLSIMPNNEMKFKPGEDFNYNNSAFILLAIIIEQLTGDYHKWIENEVLLKAALDDIKGLTARPALKVDDHIQRMDEKSIKQMKFEKEMYLDNHFFNEN